MTQVAPGVTVADKQIAFAKKLIALVPATLGRPYDRHVAVANAAANLQAVERGWPNDSTAIAEANALLAQLYIDGEMPRNAIEAAEHGLTVGPRDHRLLLAAAIAHDRLGDHAEASAFFEQADASFVEGRAGALEDLGALNKIAFHYEKTGQYADAARVLRRAAALPGATLLDKLVFSQRALETTIKDGDREQAKRDLNAMRSAHRALLSSARTPVQQQLIDQAEAAIERYDALLK